MLLLGTVVAVLALPAPPVSRISIGGDNNKNNNVAGNDGTGNVNNDNSGNDGTLINSGQNGNGARALQSRISIGGNSNTNNNIADNNGTGNVNNDNSDNGGTLTNNGQNNNGASQPGPGAPIIIIF